MSPFSDLHEVTRPSLHCGNHTEVWEGPCDCLPTPGGHVLRRNVCSHLFGCFALAVTLIMILAPTHIVILCMRKGSKKKIIIIINFFCVSAGEITENWATSLETQGVNPRTKRPKVCLQLDYGFCKHCGSRYCSSGSKIKWRSTPFHLSQSNGKSLWVQNTRLHG